MMTSTLHSVFLVRHGEAEPWPLPAYATPPGPPLTERGRGDAEAAGAWLAGALGESPVRLVHSPMLRTLQTAETIASHLASASLELDPRVMEIGVKESGEDAQARMVDFYRDATFDMDRPVVLAGHRAPLEALLCHVTGVTMPSRPARGSLSPDCCFFMIPATIYRIDVGTGAVVLVHGGTELWDPVALKCVPREVTGRE